MVVGSLRADIAELSKIAGGLRNTSDQLLYKLGPNLTSGEIGHPKVAKAVDEFYTNWDYRRRELATALGTLSRLVFEAADMYKKTEDGIIEACRMNWDSDSTPSSGGGSGAGAGAAASTGAGAGGSAGSAGSGGGPNSRSTAPYAQGDARWAAMTPEERQEYLRTHDLEQIGNDDANPPHMRYAANHVRVEQEIAYLESKSNLTEAEERRLASYRRLVEGNPPKQILYFDPSGDGKIAVVEGDLSNASNVAVKVPGISNDLDNIDGPIAEGERLHAETGPGSAVVTWLYDAPVGVSLSKIPDGLAQITNDAMARQAAPELCNFINGLQRGVGPQPEVTVIGHSYGSLVVGLAAKQGLNVDNIVFIGSPGVGVDSVAEFNPPPPNGPRVFAAEPGAIPLVGDYGVGGDYVSNLGHAVHPFKGVPTEPGFGATVVDIGERGKAWETHDDYYQAGSKSIKQLASIVNNNRPL